MVGFVGLSDADFLKVIRDYINRHSKSCPLVHFSKYSLFEPHYGPFLYCRVEPGQADHVYLIKCKITVVKQPLIKIAWSPLWYQEEITIDMADPKSAKLLDEQLWKIRKELERGEARKVMDRDD